MATCIYDMSLFQKVFGVELGGKIIGQVVMRCNNGTIRECQKNGGSKFRIYKYVPEGWVIEFALGVPVAKEEGNELSDSFFKFFIFCYEILREKQQLFRKRCVLDFSYGCV